MHNKLPMRKRTRLKEYDYSQAGSYFVTLCIEDGSNLLGNVVVGSGFHARPHVELSTLGISVQKTIEYIHSNDKKVEIPSYVIMPNHVHMLINLNNANAIVSTVGHGSPTLQSVVGRIKSYTTKQWNEMCNTKYKTFWQDSFHDHIIREESDYLLHWQYFENNPSKWAEDRYYMQ